MVKVIMGLKGTGKTKMLIDMANTAVNSENGNVVCIEKGSKLKFDINHSVRLIDTDEFNIDKFGEFYGLVSGIIGCDRDITVIFVDSILKICKDGTDNFELFLDKLNALGEKENVKFVITASADAATASEGIKKYF